MCNRKLKYCTRYIQPSLKWIRTMSSNYSQQRIHRRCRRRSFEKTTPGQQGAQNTLLNYAENQELNLSSVHANTMDHKRLLNDIQNNPNIKTLRVHGFFVQKLSLGYQELFWETVCNLPHLETLHMSYFLDCDLSASAWNACLRRATSLTKISIHDVVLSTCDIATISLEHLSALTAISISQVHLSQHHRKDGVHPLIAMCVTAPNLQSLILRMAHQQLQQQQQHESLLISKSLDLLAQTTLTTLELRRIVHSHDSLSHLLQHLIQATCPLSQTLKYLALDMEDHLSHRGFVSIGEMLQSNSRLERLELLGSRIDRDGIVFRAQPLQDSTSHLMKRHITRSFPWNSTLMNLLLHTENYLSYECCVSIGEILRHNSRLERLELWGSSVDEDGLILMVQSLQSNRQLKALYMSHDTSSVRAQKAFVAMLQHHNFTLEALVLRSLGRWNEEFLKTIIFYLRLNATQIRELLLNVNVTQMQFLDKLVLHTDTLDYVFHLLRGNPSFMSHACFSDASSTVGYNENSAQLRSILNT